LLTFLRSAAGATTYAASICATLFRPTKQGVSKIETNCFRAKQWTAEAVVTEGHIL
jgi:hypothetical protein